MYNKAVSASDKLKEKTGGWDAVRKVGQAISGLDDRQKLLLINLNDLEFEDADLEQLFWRDMATKVGDGLSKAAEKGKEYGKALLKVGAATDKVLGDIAPENKKKYWDPYYGKAVAASDKLHEKTGGWDGLGKVGKAVSSLDDRKTPAQLVMLTLA